MRTLLVLVVMALQAGRSTAQQATAASAERAYVASDGVRVRYVMRGSGPPLVLLHGFALSAEHNWLMPGAVDSLAGGFTVIALDLRGHGGSDKPRDPASYGARYVSDAIGVLDHLGIAKARFAGYSMGGMILLRLVTMHPDRVHSAVLGGAGWQPPSSGPPPAHIVQWIENLDRAAREGTSVSDALRLPGLAPLPPAAVARLDRNDPAVLAAVLRSAGGLAVQREDVRRVTVPLHIVVGETDVGARAAADSLRTVLPQVEVTIIPAADHRQAMSHPRLASAIRAFLQAH